MKTLLIFFAALLSLISVTNAQTAPRAKGLRVEIMMFSGRPNPVFEITHPDKIREVQLLIGAILQKSGSKDVPEHPKLGYQGIVVTSANPSESGFHSLRVKGVSTKIQAGPGGASKGSESADVSVNDSSPALETRLLALAREQGVIDDQMLEFIKKSK